MITKWPEKPEQIPDWQSGEAPTWLLPAKDTSIEENQRARSVYLDWLDFNHKRDRAAWARWLTSDGYFSQIDMPEES